MTLFSRHSLGLQTIYSDIKRRALEQTLILVGTPGSVGERAVGDGRFVYRQFYDSAGKKRAQYIGPAGEPDAMATERTIRDAIATTDELLSEARVLARQGYVRVDARTSAVLAPCVNHGLFRAGGVLVGSHAYGALLNELGVRAAAYRTEDVDIARRAALTSQSNAPTLQSILDESMLTFSAVLGFDRKGAPTSFRTRGRDALRVDILAPTSRSEPTIVPVPELHAHAMGLPHLAYLVSDPIDVIVLGRTAVLPVRVPRPERLAWHKLLVSTLRGHTSEKKSKDVQQASVLIACLAEMEPGALEDAFAALPRGTRSKVAGPAATVRRSLETEGHEAGAAVIASVLKN